MKRLTPWFVLCLVTVITIGCNTGGGKSNGGESGGKSETASLPVDEFRKAVVGKVWTPKQKFYDEYGEPTRIRDIGSHTYLYYKCKDGDVVVKTGKGPFQYQDLIAPLTVDRR